MDPSRLVADAVQASHIIEDVSALLRPLVTNLREAGVQIQSPELRLKCPQETIEYSAGLVLKDKLWSGPKARLKIPPPRRFGLYSLFPYEPVENACTIGEDGVVLDRAALRGRGESFRVELEYDFSGDSAIRSLVYSSSPPELVSRGSEEDVQRFWLHSELKSVDFLRDLYRRVRLEELGVEVDVTLRDEIRDAFSPELRHDIGMMAKLQSKDRNELARAMAYKKHHKMPDFSGDLFASMKAAEELVQPSHFRRFLDLEGPYRLARCSRGAEFTDVLLPMSLPHSMVVYSTTDLTLDSPASDGKLIYRKSAFAKRLRTTFEGK